MDRLKRERIDPNNKTKEAVDENYDPIAMMRDKLKGEGSSTSDTRATTDDHRIWYKSVVGDKAETSMYARYTIFISNSKILRNFSSQLNRYASQKTISWGTIFDSFFTVFRWKGQLTRDRVAPGF